MIKQPRVTEKSQLMKQVRQYVFDVDKKANKAEVKKAVEYIYNVKVEKVRIINISAKKRRLGATQGKKSGHKKAIVTLKEGYQIEIIPQK
ncbi:MAG: 50S ribosomal protein L23 [Patescibacteria group bacterium]|nr:50S ribosomal protein L23 [Patescibacteria group bacterium]